MAKFWRDVTRSDVPWNWKEIYKRVAFTPEQLAIRLSQLTEGNRPMTMPILANEENVDMDEVTKETVETESETEIVEADEEPDSDLDDSDDIEEVEGDETEDEEPK